MGKKGPNNSARNQQPILSTKRLATTAYEEGQTSVAMPITAVPTPNSNLKSFEYLLKVLIQTQNQCRDEQTQRFTQLEVSDFETCLNENI